ncbi:hypothetical protein SEPCBS119000_002362 [Sporothrix epigloea]|uniref:Uncharacterized protein n=1 Tax=Sporothrix epigloea TaxID=1892477 RepID=A0ABP0DJV0_9PEZI
MPSDVMKNARAVRREDLIREAESPGDGLFLRRTGEDEETVAVRAALDAYMEGTLGIDFGLASQQPARFEAAMVNVKSKTSTDKKDTKMADGDEPTDSSDDDGDEADKDEKSLPEKSRGATEFAFRMFSGSGRAAPGTKDVAVSELVASPSVPAPIVLLDDGDGTDALGPGSIVNPVRPLSFYLAGEPSPEALAQYSQITLTGDDVKSASNARAWGWEVPWRVRTVLRAESKTAMRALIAHALSPEDAAALPTNLERLVASATNALPPWTLSMSPEPTPLPLNRRIGSIQSQTEEAVRKRCRPGKQYRVKLRKRAQARREKEVKAAAQKQSKEEHLLEKKKRLNRSKKLRRRDKKRQAKQGVEGDEGGGSGNGSEDE